MILLNYRTIQLLQARCTAHSQIDRAFVKAQMHDGTLFPMITDSAVRLEILSRLRNTPYIIPSLYTFLEDTK